MRRFDQELKGINSPIRHKSFTGRVDTVGNGGRSITVNNMNQAQFRNLTPVTPYGISSSPPPGLKAFVIVTQDSGSDGMIGVFDPNKPQCSPGECIIYSSSGSTIRCADKVYINDRDILKEIDDLKNK